MAATNFTLKPDNTRVQIVDVERYASEGIVVTFSDGTRAAYVVEELLELRPHREPIRNIKIADLYLS